MRKMNGLIFKACKRRLPLCGPTALVKASSKMIKTTLILQKGIIADYRYYCRTIKLGYRIVGPNMSIQSVQDDMWSWSVTVEYQAWLVSGIVVLNELATLHHPILWTMRESQ